MIPRTRLLWFAVLIAWVVWAALVRPWQGDAHERTAAKVGLLFPRLESQLTEVAKIQIDDGERHIHLYLTDQDSPYGPGRWMVEEKQHPVDTARLQRLVSGLAALETQDVVSVEEASHTEYGVAEGEGTRVRLYDAGGDLLVDWIAGKIRGQDIRQGQKVVFEYYMRDGQRPEVYLSADPVQPPTAAVDWCDTTFLSALDMDTVTAIQRQDFRGQDNWRLLRVTAAAADAEGVDSFWQLEEDPPEVALSFAAESLLFTLSGLHAADVVGPRTTKVTEEDARYGFPQDRFQIEVGEQKLQLDLGKPAGNGQRYLRVSGLPHLYTLSDFDVGQLRQTRARLLTRDG